MTDRPARVLLVAAYLVGMGASVALIRAAYLAIDRRLDRWLRTGRKPVGSNSSPAPYGEARKGGETATAESPRRGNVVDEVRGAEDWTRSAAIRGAGERVDTLAGQASRLTALLEAVEHAEAEMLAEDHAALGAALRGDREAYVRSHRAAIRAAQRGTAALTEVHALVRGEGE